MVSAGSDGYFLQQAEAMSMFDNGTTLRCRPKQFNNFPSFRVSTGRPLMLDTGLSSPKFAPIPVSCGGIRDDGSRSRVCFRLDSDEPIATMENHRYGAASVVMDHGKTLWVTGGYDNLLGGELHSIEKFHVSDNNQTLTKSAADGDKLPRRMSLHCTEMVSSVLLINFGGEEYGSSVPIIDQTWTRDLNANDGQNWIPRSPMNKARKEHSCGVIVNVGGCRERAKMIVVGAGGILSDYQITDSVELLTVLFNENGIEIGPLWQEDQKLPLPLYAASSTTSVDQTKLYVAGGYTVYNEARWDVLCFQCFDLECNWQNIGLLLAPRIDGIAYMLPPITDNDWPFLDIKSTTSQPSSNCTSGEPIHTMMQTKCILFSLKLDISLLMVIGSDGNEEFMDSEIFSISHHNDGSKLFAKSTANIDQLIAGSFATAGLLRSPGEENTWISLVCGGKNNFGLTMRNCYQHLGSAASPVSQLIFERRGAAGVVINDGTDLWVTGGKDSNNHYLANSELLEGSTNFSPILHWPLPQSMAFHCLQQLDDSKTVILYGGEWWTDNAFDNVADSWILDLTANNGQWIPAGSFSVARSAHMCGVLKRGSTIGLDDSTEIVVAAGGLNSDLFALDSVELLEIVFPNDNSQLYYQSLSWKEGPKLPIPLYFAAAATTGDKGVLFLVGGVTSYEPREHSLLVFNLKCLGIICEWSKNIMELSKIQIAPVATILPPFAKLSDTSIASDTTSVACNWASIGDDICEGDYNNWMCEYDGDDCCSGTDEGCYYCAGNLCNCHRTGSHMCAGNYNLGMSTIDLMSCKYFFSQEHVHGEVMECVTESIIIMNATMMTAIAVWLKPIVLTATRKNAFALTLACLTVYE